MRPTARVHFPHHVQLLAVRGNRFCRGCVLAKPNLPPIKKIATEGDATALRKAVQSMSPNTCNIDGLTPLHQVSRED